MLIKVKQAVRYRRNNSESGNLRLSAPRRKRKLQEGLRKYMDEKKRIKTSSSSKDNLIEIPLSEKLKGRRIVDISHLILSFQELDDHSPFGCNFKNMIFMSEKRLGLRSGFVFKCNMCNIEKCVWSEPKNDRLMNVNTCAVSGTICTGGGHAQLEETLSAMDIPCVSKDTFKKYHDKVCKGWEKTAEQEMRLAAKEEKRLAIESKQIDEDGVPWITVVADGAWCKRSYRTNYSSLSGVGAIVGYRTGKVLFIGVRNKYCIICIRAQQKNEIAKQHVCYKNWSRKQSSTSMEASAIVEGFSKSEEMYGLRYGQIIADGDSSVYKQLLDCRPYIGHTIEKIECRNHLLRNFCNQLRDIVKRSNRERNNVACRKLIGDNILRMRSAVIKAIDYRSKQQIELPLKIEELRKDILNSPFHIFGDHKNCQERNYFCDRFKNNERNFVPSIAENGLWENIYDFVWRLSFHSRSLMYNVDSNNVEHYNAIVAKFIGGKRINFARGGSYAGRCAGAVVRHNTALPHYHLHKQLCKISPGIYTKKFEMQKKINNENRKKPTTRRALFNTCKSSKSDKFYGPNAEKPDMNEVDFNKASQAFLLKLKKNQDEIKEIERATVLQGYSRRWIDIRRNILTASIFGDVCKMLPTTSCSNMVKKILYSNFDCEAMEYGRKYENKAKVEIEKILQKNIDPCGLFIDPVHNFLGASPDGTIDDDGLVEIKCPSSAATMTPDEAIKKKKVTVWALSKTGEILPGLRKNHSFFYQIQGQLHVTRRKYCIFTLWTPLGVKVERVEREDQFWEKQMFGKLEKFYMNCLLPELIDPRYSRSMLIRDPSYITDAQALKKSKATVTGSND